MVQGEQLTLAAQVWTSNAAGGLAPEYEELEMPAVAPPEALAPPRSNPGGFAFWENFDLRIASSEGRGRPEPRGARTERWLRFRGREPGEDPFLSEARALVLIDTMLWPAHWSRRATPLDYAAPSLDVSVWFHQPSADADWLLIEARAPVSAGGLVYGEGRVWTRAGRLVASGASNMLVLPSPTPQ
jgi:acyl-CoA thioesterase-2